MDLKIALVNISDLQQCKDAMCNEIKNYSQDFAVRELEHNQLIRKMEENVARNEQSECASTRRN